MTCCTFLNRKHGRHARLGLSMNKKPLRHYFLRHSGFFHEARANFVVLWTSCWSAGPRRPSDQSDAFVAGFLYMFVSICLTIFLSRRRVPTSFSQSLVSPPLQLPCQKDQPGHRCFNL